LLLSEITEAPTESSGEQSGDASEEEADKQNFFSFLPELLGEQWCPIIFNAIIMAYMIYQPYKQYKNVKKKNAY